LLLATGLLFDELLSILRS